MSGIYPTNGWLPITVSLEGSKITIGTVGGNSAVFTGTVSGNSMSGEWRFTNGFDQGSWQGTKVSEDNSLPCAPETPSTSTTTTTQHSGGGAVCSFPPPPGYSDAFNSMYDTAATVFGSENLVCYYSGMVGGVQYAATFMLSNYDNSQAQQYAGEIVEQLNANGWSNATITYVNDSGFQVGGVYINGQTPLMGALSVIISGEEVDLTIQIQPMTPG